MPVFENPPSHCMLCPRLAQFRVENQAHFPDKFNAPVPAFGAQDAALLVVGLAPGLKGANFTGRPFTGDFAGDLLYSSLLRFGFAKGSYGAHTDDGLQLINCRITNAVRCVPPENKPTGPEIRQCMSFLQKELAALSCLKIILSLGKISHDAVVRTTGGKMKDYPFQHGRFHTLPTGLTLADSYHCSRYNTNTGRLTEAMFHDVIRAIAVQLGSESQATGS